nr:hypothetical protein GCM10020093_082910 [Planobispora longispora]
MVATADDRSLPVTGTFPLVGDMNWEKGYVRGSVLGDTACGLLVFAGLIATRTALGGFYLPELALGVMLTVLWPVAVSIAGGYQAHRVGDGPDEYRAVLQAAAALASLVAIIAYATQTPIARSYVMAASRCWPSSPSASGTAGASGCTGAGRRAKGCAGWSSSATRRRWRS